MGTVAVCSRACAAEHYRRRKADNSIWPKLFGHLAGLEPVREPPRPKRRAAMPGRPANRTGRKAIAKIERTRAVLQMRFAGHTFAQIGQRLDPPVSAQMAHRLYWQALDANPFDPARIRRQAARERRILSNDHASG